MVFIGMLSLECSAWKGLRHVLYGRSLVDETDNATCKLSLCCFIGSALLWETSPLCFVVDVSSSIYWRGFVDTIVQCWIRHKINKQSVIDRSIAYSAGFSL